MGTFLEKEHLWILQNIKKIYDLRAATAFQTQDYREMSHKNALENL